MRKILFVLFVITSLISCSEYQKALKSEEISVKFDAATKQFDAKKYNKALRLMEQIAPSYRGKPQAEKLFYMMGASYYKTKQYALAGFEFERFVANYPRSEKLEEVAYLAAKSYYYDSPVYSLEQTSTYKAIEKLQLFINTYPNSAYQAEANTIVKELTEKLEFKAFEIAKQYNLIGDFKAALVALDNFIIENPGTKYKEDALYYRYDSAYQLAINSIDEKKEERLQNAKQLYTNLVKFKNDTKYLEKANEMVTKIETELNLLKK